MLRLVEFHRLDSKKHTQLVFPIQFGPILHNHFELFENKTMSKSVSSGMILNKVVLMS